MLQNIDEEFNLLLRQNRQYEVSITQLHEKIEESIDRFRMAAQSLCAISEAFGRGWGATRGGGLSFEACDYMNATTIIAGDAISDFEIALRKHIISTKDCIAQENKRIEMKLRARLDLLRAHDIAFRALARARALCTGTTMASNEVANPSSFEERTTGLSSRPENDQDSRVARLRTDFLRGHELIKGDLRALLAGRAALYHEILVELSDIQLRLLGRMYNALGTSAGYRAEVPALKRETKAERKLERTGAGDSGAAREVFDTRQKGGESKAPHSSMHAAATDISQWGRGVEGFVGPAPRLGEPPSGMDVASAVLEGLVARVEAIAICEQRVAEEELTALSNVVAAAGGGGERRLSFFLSAQPRPVVTGSTAFTASSDAQSVLPVQTTPVAPAPGNAFVTAAGETGVHGNRTGGGSRGDNPLNRLRKMLGSGGMKGGEGGAAEESDVGGLGGGQGRGREEDPQKTQSEREEEGQGAGQEEAKDGWARLEDDFQASLLEAASKIPTCGWRKKEEEPEEGKASSSEVAEGTFIPSASSPGTRRGYLASLASFKAFHNPFRPIGRALGSPPSQCDRSEDSWGTAPGARHQLVRDKETRPQALGWSPERDAEKYQSLTHREEIATLRSILFPSYLPTCSTSPLAAGNETPLTTSLGMPGAFSSPSHLRPSSNTTTTPPLPPPPFVFKHHPDRLAWLGAGLRFLDVVGLAEASCVSKEWERLLRRDARGHEAWRQAVRGGGVPEGVRARFWYYLLYSPSIPWRPSFPLRSGRDSNGKSKSAPDAWAGSSPVHTLDLKDEATTGAHGGRTLSGPRRPVPGLYQSLVARALEQIRQYQEAGRMAGSGSPEGVLEEAGGGSANEWGDEQEPQQASSGLSREGKGDEGGEMAGTGRCGGGGGARGLEPREPHHSPPRMPLARADTYGQYRSNWINEIAVDVERTYVVEPDGDARESLCFQSPTPSEGSCTPERQRPRLSRVLQAYAIYHPRLKYCQGMNTCVALLLMVTKNDEEAAFWLLVGLAEECGMREVWMEGMPRLKACFAVFDRLLRIRTPGLHAHFLETGVHVAMFSSKWFVTLYANLDTLPPQAVLRVWDVFLVEGWSVIFGVAVSLIEMLEGQLRDLDLEDILRLVQNPRAALLACSTTRADGGSRREKEEEEGGQDGGQTRQDGDPLQDGEKGVAIRGVVGEEKGGKCGMAHCGEAGPMSTLSCMPTILLRRASAIAEGAQVFADVQKEYNL